MTRKSPTRDSISSTAAVRPERSAASWAGSPGPCGPASCCYRWTHSARQRYEAEKHNLPLRGRLLQGRFPPMLPGPGRNLVGPSELCVLKSYHRCVTRSPRKGAEANRPLLLTRKKKPCGLLINAAAASLFLFFTCFWLFFVFWVFFLENRLGDAKLLWTRVSFVSLVLLPSSGSIWRHLDATKNPESRAGEACCGLNVTLQNSDAGKVIPELPADGKQS